MSFSFSFGKKQRYRDYRSSPADHHLHLGLELLERRCLLSANLMNMASGGAPNPPAQSNFGQPVPAAIGPSAVSLAASPSPTPAPPTLGSNPLPPDSTPTGVQQVFFTVSLLASGAQVPILPYERVIVPAPTPNLQPQPFYPAITVPELTMTTVPVGVLTARPRGTGGDVNFGGANPEGSEGEGSTPNQSSPTFGEPENGTSPTDGSQLDMNERTTELNDLNFLGNGPGTGSNQNSDFPAGQHDGALEGTTDWLDDGAGFEPDNATQPGNSMQPGGDPGRSGSQNGDLEYARQVVLLDAVSQPSMANRRAAAEGERSNSSVSVGAIAAWAILSSNRGSGSNDRVGYFERRRKA